MSRHLVIILIALAAAPAAIAAGPMPYASQGGGGVATADGKTRYVAVPANSGANTTLVAIHTRDGTVKRSLPLDGAWGVPVLTYGSIEGQGVSSDGRTLVLEDMVGTFPHTPSRFLLVSLPSMNVRARVFLKGDFAFDALSPDGKRLYLIQHVDKLDLTRYVVRVYDTGEARLMPGRIADRTQKSWIMKGYPVSRAASPDGRWVYTLYGNGSEYPFVHALDTVRGVAHCIGLPLRGTGAYNLRLTLDGKALRVHWLSGRRWLLMDTRTWRLSADRGGGFPWWTLAFLALVPALLLVRRDRGARGRRVSALEAVSQP